MGRVRSKANALARLLDTITRPVYVVDRHRVLIYCNAACGDLIGVDPAKLVGQECAYHAPTENTVEALVSCFCPPPRTFAGQGMDQDVTLVHQDGHALEMRAHCIPLGADRVTCAGVLVVLLPVDSAGKQPSADIELDAAALHQRLARYSADIQVSAGPLDELVGRSRGMRRVREQIKLAAAGPTHVLILGPPGSGREHIARAIHRETARHEAGPLVPVLCSAMDAELLQDAIRSFARQTADLPSPTPPAILLLEVDQLPYDAQIELMGFLDLPGFHLYTVATARQSLLSLAAQDKFQVDLAHALSTLVIDVPPLCQRREDIPLLAQHFVEKFNGLGGQQHEGFSADALDELTGYDWPENVDELAATVMQCCQQAHGEVIQTDELTAHIRWAADADAHPVQAVEPISLDQLLLDVEREMILRALRLTKGNKTKAANLLDIPRARLHRRIEHLGLS